jgi:hypothetical protein
MAAVKREAGMASFILFLQKGLVERIKGEGSGATLFLEGVRQEVVGQI